MFRQHSPLPAAAGWLPAPLLFAACAAGLMYTARGKAAPPETVPAVRQRGLVHVGWGGGGQPHRPAGCRHDGQARPACWVLEQQCARCACPLMRAQSLTPLPSTRQAQAGMTWASHHLRLAVPPFIQRRAGLRLPLHAPHTAATGGGGVTASVWRGWRDAAGSGGGRLLER